MNQRLSKIVLLCAVLSTACGLGAFVAQRSEGACAPGCTTGSDFYVGRTGNIYIRHVFSVQVASNNVNIFEPDPQLYAWGSVSATRSIWRNSYVSCSDFRCTPICHAGLAFSPEKESEVTANYRNKCVKLSD